MFFVLRMKIFITISHQKTYTYSFICTGFRLFKRYEEESENHLWLYYSGLATINILIYNILDLFSRIYGVVCVCRYVCIYIDVNAYIDNESVFNTSRNILLGCLPFSLNHISRKSFHANRSGTFLFTLAAWFCNIIKYYGFLNIYLFNFS